MKMERNERQTRDMTFFKMKLLMGLMPNNSTVVGFYEGWKGLGPT